MNNQALQLGYDEDQRAIVEAVRRFCVMANSEALARNTHQPFQRAAWEQLAQLGVFSAAAPGQEDAGGATAICAICEALGEHVFPGPVSATYAAIQILATDELPGVIAGTTLVSMRPSRGQLLPYGPYADIFLAREGNAIKRAQLKSEVEATATLAGEYCGRARLKLGEPLANSHQALAMSDIATAAYLVGAADALLHSTAEHAATRKQFGKTLGEFQAVTHPLADCALNITTARLLTRNAACGFDSTGNLIETSSADAVTALLSAARAARDCAFICHQIYGALGVTLEGPLFHYTRRIQQLISLTLDDTNTVDLLQEIGLGENQHDSD